MSQSSQNGDRIEGLPEGYRLGKCVSSGMEERGRGLITLELLPIEPEQPKQLEAVIVVPIDPTAEATIKRNHDFVSVLIGNTEYRKASVVIRQRKTEGQDG